MKKRWVDDLSKRKIITFYYPIESLIQDMMKETSVRVKLAMDANQSVPDSLVFHPIGDREWLKDELRQAIVTAMNIFGKMTYGIDPDLALFYEKEIDGKTSCGFSVNDYGRQQKQALADLDNVIRLALIYSMCFRWFIQKNHGETAKYYQTEAAASTRGLYKGIDLLKRKKRMLKFEDLNDTHLPDEYNMKRSLSNFLNTNEDR